MPGGCVFNAAAAELDDKPGPARDLLVASRKLWLSTLVKAIRLAVEQGHLIPTTDAEQMAFELMGVALGYHHHRRLLRDGRAEARAHAAFERLLTAATAA
jgi:hypothetical protein